MTKIINNSLVSAKVDFENKCSKFTTTFSIPFKEGNVNYNPDLWKDLLGSWATVCISALESRMQSCVTMLYRNLDNVIISDEIQIVFKKSNGQIHSFNHPSFNAMKNLIDQFKSGNWTCVKKNTSGILQLLKALYWIPEDDRKDHGGFGFGQLISCLEAFVLAQDKF